MLLRGRPLYDNKADSALFVMPAEWNPVLHGVERQINVLLPGPRGSGKTSLLHQIQFVMREQGEPVAFVDGTATSNVLELASRIRNAVRGEPSPMATGAEMAVDAFKASDEPIAGASRSLATLLRSIGDADPTLILLDASGAPEAVYDLFGRMRDVLWQQDHHWVVAIDDNDRSTVLRPPADAFFDLVVALDQWSTNDLAELLARRSSADQPIDPLLVTNAAAGANGNPREALRALSHGVVNKEDPSAFLTERGVLLDKAARLGRPHAMLMADLLDRGQASPSDEELQDSLGITRTRLTQLFHVLQEERLVVAETERPTGPGRPRIVYRPTLSS